MNENRLRSLGYGRELALDAYEQAHRRALDAVVDELTRNPGASVTRAAELIGVTRRTIYRALMGSAALAEREARAGGPPAPAPNEFEEDSTPLAVEIVPEDAEFGLRMCSRCRSCPDREPNRKGKR